VPRVTIAFDGAGAGPPLVLLHGTGSRRGVWDPVIAAVSRQRRTLALDLPGFGASPPGDFEPSVDAYVARLARWFAEQGLERPHVAGNSMGGGIALELARARLVASATAISPVGFWTPRELRFAQRSVRASHAIGRLLRPGARAITRSAVGRTMLVGCAPARGACPRARRWPISRPSSTRRGSSRRWSPSADTASTTATSCAACR
jgi:pimeloyl-ACP methyl ester carboxylesterase